MSRPGGVNDSHPLNTRDTGSNGPLGSEKDFFLSVFVVMIFDVVLLNHLHLAHEPRPRLSSPGLATPFVNQKRLVLKFPNDPIDGSKNAKSEIPYV